MTPAQEAKGQLEFKGVITSTIITHIIQRNKIKGGKKSNLKLLEWRSKATSITLVLPIHTKQKDFFFWLLLTRVSRAIQASDYSPRNVKTSPHILYTPGNYPEESLGVDPKMLSIKTKIFKTTGKI